MDSGTEHIGVCNIGKWTVGQSVSECAILVNGQYIQRQYTVCVERQWNMCGGNCTAESCVAMYRNWYGKVQWRTEGIGLGGSNSPRNSEILTKYQKLRKFYYMK
jgi:hypothetical protein